jgi:hypothetical protein
MALKRNSYLNPGVRVEGILRQSADVDDVDQRVKEYEQGACSSESPQISCGIFLVDSRG